ncbi:MAG: hypothetical protein ACREVG_11930 [Burkholderiales bacterium]
MDAFMKGDVYIDYPFEGAKFRYDKKSEKVYRRFYGEAEDEILPSSSLYNDAIRTGKAITREEYFRDPPAARAEGATIDGNDFIGATRKAAPSCFFTIIRSPLPFTLYAGRSCAATPDRAPPGDGRG